MYKEIHPLRRNSAAVLNAPITSDKPKDKDIYVQKKPIVKRLDTIDSVEPMDTDGTVSLFRIRLNDRPEDDIIVSEAEGEEINKLLLKKHGVEKLAEEVNSLASAVRQLWDLLRHRPL